MLKTIERVFKATLATAVIVFSLYSTAQAQLDNISEFLRGGTEDATKLARAYLSPLPTGLSTALNTGWTDRAGAKKFLSLSIEVRAALAFVPDSDQEFDINSLGLQNLILQPGESNIAPTLAGSDNTAPRMDVFAGEGANRRKVGEFDLPQGSGFQAVPAPMIQASVGLFAGTDVTLRLIPETDLDEYGDISLFGFGVKHQINSWLPGGKMLPVDLSLMFGYSQVELNADLSDALSGSGQKVETTTDTWVLNALVGKTLPFVSIYGGVGIQGGNFDLDVKGDFDIITVDPITGTEQTTTLRDPVSFSDDSDSTIHLLGGVRFKLGFLRIFAEGTLADYATVNAGIGIGFR